MSESNKRGLNDLSKSFAEAVSRTPKKQREGSVSDSTNPSPIGASTPIGTSTMATQPQYVVNAPFTISTEDIQKSRKPSEMRLKIHFVMNLPT